MGLSENLKVLSGYLMPMTEPFFYFAAEFKQTVNMNHFETTNITIWK